MFHYIISSSLVFFFRRNFRPQAKQIDNIIVDMDRTLLTTNIGKEALISCYGKEKADDIEHSLMKKVANGALTMGEAMLRGNNYLVEGHFNKNILYNYLVEKCVSGEFIRKGLLDSILKLQKKGKKIILATMSTQRTATILAEKYGFFGAIGTHEHYDDESGKMLGCSQIICEENKDVNGVKFRTKLYLLKELFNEKNLIFSPEKTAIITDDVTDLYVMREVALALFLKLREPTKIQKLCYKLKLFDHSIVENEDLEKFIQ